MIAGLIIAVMLTAQPRPARLSPALDAPGSWVAIHATRVEAPYTARVLTYSRDTITVSGFVLPKLVEIRRVGGDAEWVRNPLYVGTVEIRTADLELTYDGGDTVLVSSDFPLTEDGGAYHDEIRREIQRRLDSGNLWQTSNTAIRETSGVYLETAVALPSPVSATRVAYRVYVPDPVRDDEQRLAIQLAASRVASQFPSATGIEASIVRELVLPKWSRVSLRGSVEKTE